MPSRTAVYSSLAVPQTTRPFFGPPRPRPVVLLLQLQKESFFDDQYEQLLCLLKTKADVQSITSRSAASGLFNSPSRHVVLATDQALTQAKNSPLRDEARQYVRTGGTLIFCCHFPGQTSVPDMDKLFTSFGLQWQYGNYHRTEHSINDMGRIDTTGLSPRYSQKAVHLQKVSKQDAIYLPSMTSHIQSMVFPPSPIEDLTQTPAALTSCGRGRVGYLGDVNGEEETDNVVLAMCRLH